MRKKRKMATSWDTPEDLAQFLGEKDSSHASVFASDLELNKGTIKLTDGENGKIASCEDDQIENLKKHYAEFKAKGYLASRNDSSISPPTPSSLGDPPLDSPPDSSIDIDTDEKRDDDSLSTQTVVAPAVPLPSDSQQKEKAYLRSDSPLPSIEQKDKVAALEKKAKITAAIGLFAAVVAIACAVASIVFPPAAVVLLPIAITAVAIEYGTLGASMVYTSKASKANAAMDTSQSRNVDNPERSSPTKGRSKDIDQSIERQQSNEMQLGSEGHALSPDLPNPSVTSSNSRSVTTPSSSAPPRPSTVKQPRKNETVKLPAHQFFKMLKDRPQEVPFNIVSTSDKTATLESIYQKGKFGEGTKYEVDFSKSREPLHDAALKRFKEMADRGEKTFTAEVQKSRHSIGNAINIKLGNALEFNRPAGHGNKVGKSI